MKWFVEFKTTFFSPMCQARKFLVVLSMAILIPLMYAQLNFVSPVSAANPPFQLTWSSSESVYTESIAWGDYDGDGDLDLAAAGPGGGSEVRIYQNDNGVLTARAVKIITVGLGPTCIAWGDYDNDGDIDLVIGTMTNGYIILYSNEGVTGDGAPILTSAWNSTNGSDNITSVAWGDYNGDSRPDLAVGNNGQPNRLFKNINGTLTLDTNWSPQADQTMSLAWGDVDSDGDLDLAVGNTSNVKLYRNNGGFLLLDSGWSQTNGEARSLAWGDYDADGYLDLAVGGTCPSIFCISASVYHNNSGMLESNASWGTLAGQTRSIAWGDFDRDGDLDLAIGDFGTSNQLLRNDGRNPNTGNLDFTPVWNSSVGDQTTSIAWGDIDNDGDLDLAVGNEGQPNRVYRNENGLLIATVYSFPLHGSVREVGESVAWGDYDNDGDLDVAVGINCFGRSDCRSIRLLQNHNGVFSDWYSAESDYTWSIAWGDYDRDGFLDLAVANDGQSRLYHNNGSGLTLLAGWAPLTPKARSVAWGDYDSDGDLDLVVGIDCSGQGPCRSVRLYRNDGGVLTSNEVWSTIQGFDPTRSVAWGDYDGDGDLDLAVGNYGSDLALYRNDGVFSNGTPIFVLFWLTAGTPGDRDRTTSIAWGDYNGDGRLDLAVGNANQSNRLYRNEGVSNNGSPIFTLVWSSAETPSTDSIAWGDYDGDGDLDLAIGANNPSPIGSGGRLLIYRNDNGILTTGAVTNWSSFASPIAWGDYDGDGDLDLVDGTEIYRNERDANSWKNSIPTVSVAYPGAKSDFYSTAEILSNEIIPVTYKLASPRAITVKNVRAEFSLIGGSKGISSTWLSAVAGSGTDIPPLATTTAYRYTLPSINWINITTDGTPVTLSDDSVAGPINLGFKFDFFDQAFNQFWISSNGFISFGTPSTSYSNICLPHSSAPANLVAPFWDDLNPAVGGQVYYRKVDADTMVVEWYQVPHHTSSGSGTYTFEAIIRRDGTITFQYLSMSGTLDSATIGIQNNNGTRATQASCNANFVSNNLALRFYNPGQTYKFNWDVYKSGFFGESDNVVFRMVAIPDVRTKPNSVPGPFLYGSYATQTFPFRVRGTQILVMNGGSRVANALVYRLPVGQTGRASAISDANSQPFHTDLMGYLQGRGELYRDDKLVALAPIASTPNYALYYTNAPPNRDGLHMYTVSASGIQTLTVSSSYPLVLLNLDISLEWDARKDKEYLALFKYDLQRASDFLYDWTNGQVALGQLNIYHDKQNWTSADIRVYASNRFRPNAIQGGIVSTIVTDPISPTIEYAPGHVRMGATWNRYGNASGSLGQDWPRALAHELGHYALFLDDDYLGLNPDGLLVPLQQPYTSECKYTAMTDPYRDDYSEFHYQSNWLTECKDTLAANTTKRWDWGTITSFYPLNESPGATGSGPNSLPLTVTQIKENDPGAPIQTLDDPTFFLVKDSSRYQPGTGARAILYQNDRMIDLGRPTLDQVIARGARIDDRLCVYELAVQRVGCAKISSGNKELTLASVPNWQPDIAVSPVTSRTITINVSNLSSGLTTLRVRIFPINATATMTRTLVWTGSQYGYTFGPSDLTSPTVEAHVQVWDESVPSREVIADYSLQGGPSNQWGEWSNQWGEWAPSGSGDGQVTLFGKNLKFRSDQFVVFQATTKLPTTPAGTTLIGQAYRLTSVGAPNLSGASITFQYLGREVPVGESPKIYYWNGTTLTQTNTVVNTYYNVASTFVQGPGVYALMSSVDIPLYGPGWNLISYPIQITQTVDAALRSIDPYYTMVYGYVATDKDDPWKLYAKPPIPNQINDLAYLEFGRGYWITVTQNITLALTSRTQRPTQPLNMQLPPSTFYGPLLAGAGFSPTVGMTLTASISGNPCGQGRTLNIGGMVFYVINVFAKDIGVYAGCGEMARPITFKVGTRTMMRQASWNNTHVQYLPLGLTPDIFLPFIRR